MTIQECYEKLGGNYSEVLGRLVSLRLVQKFITKFLDDTSYGELCREMELGHRKEAFRAAHTLKGVCLNLGLGNLSVSAERLTDLLRPETDQIAPEAFCELENVKLDYENTVEVIRTYLECPTD